MIYRSIAVATAMIAVATPVLAQDIGDLYVSGFTGLSITPESAFTDSGVGVSGTVDFDLPVSGGGAFGIWFTENVRAEVEVSYRQANIETASVNGVGPVAITGTLGTTVALLNAYYDILPGEVANPYVSAGLGTALQDGEVTGFGITASEVDTVLAYQVGAGVTFDLDAVAIFGGYRYLATTDPVFGTLEMQYDAHEILLGLRYPF